MDLLGILMINGDKCEDEGMYDHDQNPNLLLSLDCST